MMTTPLDHAYCYAAIQSRDPRFDGLFFVGVSTTGIYCRPICPVRMPRSDRCTFYPNAASAEQAGYRPCLRCRPELAPGNAKTDAVKRVAHLAAERIRAGALTDASLEELAAEFGLSSRQLRRAVESEYGVSPISLALTYRLLLAKQLLTDTDLKIIDVAFASGFSSLRRFNDAFRTRYRLNPSALRKRRAQKGANAMDRAIVLRLGYRPPIAWQQLTGFLCSRGNSRVDRLADNRYLRTVELGEHRGWIAALPDLDRRQICVEVSASLLPCLIPLQARLRALFDLDASPEIIDAHLQRDPALKPLVGLSAGLRVPGTLDPFELALRAILGQQVSVKAASTLFGRFVEHFGSPVDTPFDGLDRCAPSALSVAEASLQQIIDRGLTQRRAHTVLHLARSIAGGTLELDRGERSETIRQLLEIPGIGPWTAQYIAMRALGDPNALPDSDLGLVRALSLNKPAEVLRRAESWQPWRAYGAMHLWNHLSSGG
ncbi:DNA-3-methyladenine glycosylase 2 family protein [Gilvimarinus sp. F26214L]|uniref:DNA-3-methyladenine glycosylase 2 family protein n=1 Tax=Gilvimarinus sp. DZF01 TaxID=3461371 RepID=UPI00404562BB